MSVNGIPANITEMQEWYSKRARSNGRIFQIVKISEIVLAGSIPFVAIARGTWWQPWVTGALGAVVAITETIIRTLQIEQRWTDYRSVCVRMATEMSLYSAKAGPYRAIPDEDERRALFLENIAKIVSAENIGWEALQRRHPQKP